jgi:uncharacterized membrane protein SpoIIM required for sporulation
MARSGSSTISATWLSRRQADWERLRELTARAERGGVGRLERSEVRALGRLYRQAATDLAALRGEDGNEHFAQPLNALLVRAHGLIYAAPRRRVPGLGRFYRDIWLPALSDCRGCVLAAAAVFVLGAAAGAALTRTHPQFFAELAPPAIQANIRRHQMWTTSVVAVSPTASSAIMTNNISVALAMFALGIGAGVVTVYMLFFNGLLLGAVGAACARAGMSVALWSFVAPHGVLELPSICIAGGAGLRLAQGLLFPGIYARREALARAGRVAATLVLGIAPVLVAAGTIEGFVSPRPWPPGLKFALAAAVAAGGCAALAWLRRGGLRDGRGL